MQHENRETHPPVHDEMKGIMPRSTRLCSILLLVNFFLWGFLDANLSYTNTAAIACFVQFVYIWNLGSGSFIFFPWDDSDVPELN